MGKFTAASAAPMINYGGKGEKAGKGEHFSSFPFPLFPFFPFPPKFIEVELY
jgi:hypothetical protein